MSYSDVIVYAAALIAAIHYADLLSFLILLSLFCYALLDYPTYSPKFWFYLMEYIWIVFIIEFSYQLPFFCQNVNEDGQYTPSIYPYCPESIETDGLANVQVLSMIGIYKNGEAYRADGLMKTLSYYIVLFTVIALHLFVLNVYKNNIFSKLVYFQYKMIVDQN